MKRCIIFDLDGTLADTSEGILSSVRWVMQELHYPEPDESQMSQFIGPPIGSVFANMYKLSQKEGDAAGELFRFHYGNNSLFRAQLYPKVEQTLERLLQQNFILAVSTFKQEDHAIQLLKYFGIDRYFKTISGGTRGIYENKTAITLRCLEQINETPSQCILIGDTDSDFIAAKNLGIDLYGASWGFGFSETNREELHLRSRLLTDFEEIITLVVPSNAGNTQNDHAIIKEKGQEQ